MILTTPASRRSEKKWTQASQTRGIIRKLMSIQRQAALLITGAMTTTATDILNIHAALLPLPLEIERHQHRAAIRLLTLPEEHPLSDRIKDGARNQRRTYHFSPIHDLMARYGLKPNYMEKRRAVRYEASWDPKLTVNIWEGYVGTSAILYRNGQETNAICYRLGSDKYHEVYEGVCVGLILALHLAREEELAESISIWADSTAAIAATDTNKSGSSHYLLDIFHHALTALQACHPDIPVTISWIPGHIGVEGNERADQEAKKATTGRSSQKEKLPTQLHRPLPHSQTATICTFRQKLEKHHNKQWRKSPRFAQFQCIDPSDATTAS
ncbi:115 kDa protein in type-1 retrotransposable element R1DM [Lentinula edodes]|uniref:115 kDa protein in type-1 retrotransposable element R1DM n=1 Tax=Lentinula edodes TaxID=5353 RepID=A0A1Q3EBT6_LENED|nr:115 kDa protein in type-1 retrotransposable element R1DM [Lentinula edodes]